jgi:hypothetical protein
MSQSAAIRPVAPVSAIIPNYNHGHLLPKAVAALRAQTLQPSEIIIVDDGSTDDSKAVITRLLVSDPRIRFIPHPQNRGAIAALNSGIAGAKSTYVYLAAADDAASPRLIEVLLAEFEKYPDLGLVSGEVKLVDLGTGEAALRPAARPSAVPRAFSAAETAGLLKRMDNFLMTGAALIHRERLVAAGALRPELGAFADGFAVRQLALRHGFAFVPEVLAEWHVSNAGVSRQAASDPASVNRMLTTVREAFASEPAFPPTYARRFERRWKFGVTRLALDRDEEGRQLIESVGPGPRELRALVARVAKFPVVGKPLALAWLTLAYRPFALAPLIFTKLSRKRA